MTVGPCIQLVDFIRAEEGVMKAELREWHDDGGKKRNAKERSWW